MLISSDTGMAMHKNEADFVSALTASLTLATAFEPIPSLSSWECSLRFWRSSLWRKFQIPISKSLPWKLPWSPCSQGKRTAVFPPICAHELHIYETIEHLIFECPALTDIRHCFFYQNQTKGELYKEQHKGGEHLRISLYMEQHNM